GSTAGTRTKQFNDVRAAHLRHIEVENSDVYLARGHQVKGLISTFGSPNMVLGSFKYFAQQQLNAFVVIGDQHPERCLGWCTHTRHWFAVSRRHVDSIRQSSQGASQHRAERRCVHNSARTERRQGGYL